MSSSWKTTLLGIAAGIIPILQTVVTSLQNNTSLNWGSIAFGALIMALGIALVESTRAKMRFFQLPSLLGGAFVLALLSLLTYIMMGK